MKITEQMREVYKQVREFILNLKTKIEIRLDLKPLPF